MGSGAGAFPPEGRVPFAGRGLPSEVRVLSSWVGLRSYELLKYLVQNAWPVIDAPGPSGSRRMAMLLGESRTFACSCAVESMTNDVGSWSSIVPLEGG